MHEGFTRVLIADSRALPMVLVDSESIASGGPG